MSQDSWTMWKGKTRISWVWKMGNDHYGIRKKARKYGTWGMRQDSIAWKFVTQNLVVTCNLNLRTNLEYFWKSILYIPYIVSKIKNSGVQRFKQCTNRSWNEYIMAIWEQLRKAEGPFQNAFKIQLMNSK